MMMWPFFPDGESPGRRDAADADTDLSRRVSQMLTTDTRNRRQDVTITVQNRVVLLSGAVDSRDIREAFTAQVRQLPGVRDICDALVVRDDAPSLASGGIGQQDWTDAFETLVAPLGERTLERCAPAPARRTGMAAARRIAVTVAVLVVLIVVLAWPAVLMFWSLVALMAGVLLDRRPPRRR